MFKLVIAVALKLMTVKIIYIGLFLDDSNHRNKKKNVTIRNINIDEKNPISILNELRCGLKYNLIEQSGPPHNPTFKITVEIDGQTYYGEGNSKKTAKSEAAGAALKSFTQVLEDGKMVIPIHRTGSNRRIASETADKDKAAKLVKGRVTKGPLMLLNELYPNAEFTCVNNENDPYARFKITIKIRNESFTGSGRYSEKNKLFIFSCNYFFIIIGSNKKLAKNAAALTALRQLINYNVNHQFQSPIEYKSASSEEQEKADIIGR